MNKFSCTRSLGEDLFYATLIAEDAQQAKDMAVAETNKTLMGNGGRPVEWSVRVIESDIDGPARILSCGHREA
jgi:hypothetical protein